MTSVHKNASPSKKKRPRPFPSETNEARRAKYAEKRRAEIASAVEIKRGPPTKYRPEFVQQVKALAPRGLTDWEFAQAFGVTTTTLSHWRARYPEFAAAFELKAEADARVEQSLFHRAVGYTFKSEKLFFDAKKGEVVRAETVEHVPPDTASGIFWLCNRQPERWKQRRDVNVQGQLTTRAITMDMTPQEAAECFAATIHGLEPTFDNVVPAVSLAGEERTENHISQENQRLINDTTVALVKESAAQVQQTQNGLETPDTGRMCARRGA